MVDSLRKALRLLHQKGMDVRYGGSGHYKVYYQGRMIAVFSKNLDDARGWNNVMARIKRATGVEV